MKLHTRALHKAASKTTLSLSFPLSEAYLLFVYVTLLFVLFSTAVAPACLLSRLSDSSHTHCVHSIFSPSLGAGSSWGVIDRCLSAQATPRRSMAVAVAQLWQCCEFCRGGRGRRRSELRSTVGWSIRHRVKCSPREKGWGTGAQAARRRGSQR